MTALLEAVGRTGLSAAVMILAVLVLRLSFQDRTPRRAFCLLWDMVMVRLLVLAEIPSPVSIRQWLPLPSSGLRAPEPAVTAALTPGTAVYVDYGLIREARVTCVAEDVVQAAPPAIFSHPSPDWSAILFALYLAVMLMLAGGFLWSHLRSRRIYAASLPVRDAFILDWLAAHPLRRPVQARTSDRIAAPLTYGVLYPVILLPRGMDWSDRDALTCVLAHEHTHIRRFDALRKALLALALCLHWFNPLVWVMYVLANRDMELACDEAVVRSGADRAGYALALLGLEEQRGRWSPSGSHFSQNALEERIKAIMKRKHISITALVAVLVVMCITTTVFASNPPEDPKTGSEPQTGYVYDHLKTVEDDGVVIMSNGDTGEKLYSVDGGETWMSEERYQAEYGGWGDGWQVEWWAYEDYKTWLEEEKEVLQSIIGERGYTGSEGWFTWDQKRVDETIAMYEDILEKIKNGALYSKTIIDKNGSTMEGVALGSVGPLNLSVTSVFDVADITSDVCGPVDAAALLEELKAFGITGSEEGGLYYNGQLIRYFVDGAPVGDSGYSIQYVYTNDMGTVDVHTLRSVIHNPDGSYDTMGDLIGVVAAGDKGFDQELIGCAAFDRGPQVTYDTSIVPKQDQNSAAISQGTQETTAEGGDSEGGKTFEEIFAQYAAYGLTFVPTQSGIGNVYYNGQLVRHFADLKPDGSAFTFGSADGGELTLYTQYDANGKLAGLTTEAAPTKPVSAGKQDLGFAYQAPVQGKLTAAFGQSGMSFHYGIDLAAAKGTDVTAFADGTVSEVGFDATLGNYVVLSHAGGYSTLYAHCGSVTVSTGDRVAMGGKIAEVGATGRATGAVLHFELREGETYLDPGWYLDTDR